MTPRNPSSNFAKVKFPDHQKIKQELAALAEQAVQQEPQIRAIYLFGSRAVGNFSARSDADLLIVVQDDFRRPQVLIERGAIIRGHLDPATPRSVSP